MSYEPPLRSAGAWDAACCVSPRSPQHARARNGSILPPANRPYYWGAPQFCGNIFRLHFNFSCKADSRRSHFAAEGYAPTLWPASAGRPLPPASSRWWPLVRDSHLAPLGFGPFVPGAYRRRSAVARRSFNLRWRTAEPRQLSNEFLGRETLPRQQENRVAGNRRRGLTVHRVRRPDLGLPDPDELLLVPVIDLNVPAPEGILDQLFERESRIGIDRPSHPDAVAPGSERPARNGVSSRRRAGPPHGADETTRRPRESAQ